MVWEGASRSFEGRLVKAYLTPWEGVAEAEVVVSSSVRVLSVGVGVGLVTAAAEEEDGVASIWR